MMTENELFDLKNKLDMNEYIKLARKHSAQAVQLNEQLISFGYDEIAEVNRAYHAQMATYYSNMAIYYKELFIS